MTDFYDHDLQAAIARAKANGWDPDAPLPDRSPPQRMTDRLDQAEHWLDYGQPEDCQTLALLDIAESLRRIANHLDRKEQPA
jgi:hypothetical protein